jgi:hypothetical protein
VRFCVDMNLLGILSGFLWTNIILVSFVFADDVTPPEISSDTDFKAVKGKSFNLNCAFEADHTGYSAHFIHNGEVLEANSRTVLVSTAGEIESHLKLFIHEAEERDAGSYECIIKDGFNNTISTDKQMITFTNEPLRLQPRNPSVRSTTSWPTFYIKIFWNFLSPSASFLFYDSKQQLLANGSEVNNRSKYDVTFENDEITFTVKYPNINDNTNYTLVATCLGVNVSTQLFLEVDGTLDLIYSRML